MKPVYLDHNATTPLDARVGDAMRKSAENLVGNSASPHAAGRAAKAALSAARAMIATAIGAAPEEIFFTSGGTESCNLAVLGTAKARRGEGRHVITTAVEHPAVLRSVEALEEDGCAVTRLPVDRDGLPDAGDLERAIREDTILVSVMLANNETGALLPVPDLAAVAEARGVPFHTDAVQAFGKVPVDVGDLGVSLLSIAAHKLYGPRGIGALYVKKGTAVSPILFGGHQEDGLRPGTVPVPAAVGFACAVEMASLEAEPRRWHLDVLDALLLTRCRDGIGGVTLNGPEGERLPGTVNLSFDGVTGDALLIALDREGFCVATGSACMSGAALPSHVLTAMGRTRVEVSSSLRVSAGADTSPRDIERLGDALARIVERLRRVSARLR